jgi:hypothetical protein
VPGLPQRVRLGESQGAVGPLWPRGCGLGGPRGRGVFQLALPPGRRRPRRLVLLLDDGVAGQAGLARRRVPEYRRQAVLRVVVIVVVVADDVSEVVGQRVRPVGGAVVLGRQGGGPRDGSRRPLRGRGGRGALWLLRGLDVLVEIGRWWGRGRGRGWGRRDPLARPIERVRLAVAVAQRAVDRP